MPLYGQTVIVVSNNKDFKAANNGGTVAPAVVVAPWSAGTVNVRVLTDSPQTPLHFTSVTQAASKEELFDGQARWATPEQFAEWGIDLSSSYAVGNAVTAYEEAKKTSVNAGNGEAPAATE